MHSYALDWIFCIRAWLTGWDNNHVTYWTYRGQDLLLQLVPRGFEDCGKISGQMIGIIWNVYKFGEMVIIDSGFSVSKVLLAMRKWMYLGRLWSSPEERESQCCFFADEYSSDKDVGWCMTLDWVVDGWECDAKMWFSMLFLLELRTMRLQVMYNVDWSWSTIELKYPELVSCHIKTKNCVDYTNNQHHYSIEASAVLRTNSCY